MGVDCKIYLPPATRISEVVEVLGILGGNKKTQAELGGSNKGSWYVKVEDANAVSFGDSILVNCADIRFKDSNGDLRTVMYHFEGGPNGERLLMPRSRAFWLAIGKRLVDFFGGHMIYADCSDSDCDYQQEARPDIHAEDGEPWQELQQRLWNLQPLTADEIQDAIQDSAYGE